MNRGKKTLGICAIAASVCLPGAMAQTKSGTETPANVTQTLVALENKWVAALTKADIPTLDAVLADRYSDTDEDGHRGDKSEGIAVLKSGDLKFSSIKLSDIQVISYGGAAIVTGTAEQAGTFKGQVLASKIVFTDTFIYRDGMWKAVASHRSVAHAD
jgi:Domain of unknown function (DUF4440)